MKVVSAIDTKNPKNSSYKETDIIMVIKRHNYTFCVTRSYNPLMSCYMLCEYKTGRELSAFGLPLNMLDSDVDRVVERANEYLDKITPDFMKEYLARFPVMNEDIPDETESPDYADVKIKQRLKEKKEKAIMDKSISNPKKKKVVEKEKVSAVKKKRGRPKKVVEKDNTLF
jgi:hypothetical protein